MATTATSTTRRDPNAGLTPPAKLRRHPSVLIGGAFAIVLGAVVAAWAWSATTHTDEVLAARLTIHRGEIIKASDLTSVRISGDPSAARLDASSLAGVVGKRAALDIAAGSLLTPDETATQALPPAGKSVVGISLTAAQLPATRIYGGDAVRIIATPGSGGDLAAGAPDFTAAQVLDTHVDQTSGNTVVDVVVPYADASVLAARAATGNVALVLDPSSAAAGGQ
ncbi:MAG: SAF domain-containing protein [Solirubrobacteraceae bacterium]